jgi:hypothetical protein
MGLCMPRASEASIVVHAYTPATRDRIKIMGFPRFLEEFVIMILSQFHVVAGAFNMVGGSTSSYIRVPKIVRP